MKLALLLTTFAILAFNASSVLAATSTIIDAEGKTAGQVTLKEGPNGLVLDIAVEGLPQGRHGFHIHEVGTCEPHDHFKSASGHIKAGEVEHGFLHEKGYEAGDLPNLIVGEDGKAAAELFLPGLNFASLFDGDGSSFMIHENPDDHLTQPIGGAGARIACGVIEK